MRAGKVATFDFSQLLGAFDAARVANPSLVNWVASDATLAAARLGSSDSLALGGSLAYGYASDGTVGDVGYALAVELVGNAGFGSVAQALFY